MLTPVTRLALVHWFAGLGLHPMTTYLRHVQKDESWVLPQTMLLTAKHRQEREELHLSLVYSNLVEAVPFSPWYILLIRETFLEGIWRFCDSNILLFTSMQLVRRTEKSGPCRCISKNSCPMVDLLTVIVKPLIKGINTGKRTSLPLIASYRDL